MRAKGAANGGLLGRAKSLRARLVLWNMLTLAVLLAMLGLITRYLVHSFMIASVDRELMARTQRPPGQRPFAFLGPGQRPGGFGQRPEGLGLSPEGPAPGTALAPGAVRPTPPPDGTQPPPMIGEGAGPPGLPGEPPSAGAGGRQPPEWGRPPRLMRVRMMDLQGQVLAPPDESEPWDREAFRRSARGERLFVETTFEGQRIRVFSRPNPPEGLPDGVVQSAYPLADVDRAMAGLTRAFLALIPLALAAVALVGTQVTGRALRPVRAMAQAAGRIGGHDLAQRLPVASEDEFGELASTFNGMLARLEGAFSEKEQLVEWLQRLVEQQRRFTADASHELRTPIAVIKANTSLCLEGPHPEEEYRQSLEDIDRAANSMTRLVLDLLLLARSDAGQLGRDPITVPLVEVLERAAAQVAHRGGAPVRLEETDPSLCVEGNEEELTRLFTNLLENAVRYTPADGRISLSARREGSEVHATVTDTGAGIGPEHLPHLGERFYRVDPSRTRPDGGTGLGLSICKSIVEAHGGRLSFESAPGQGTTVRVVLPIQTT